MDEARDDTECLGFRGALVAPMSGIGPGGTGRGTMVGKMPSIEASGLEALASTVASYSTAQLLIYLFYCSTI